jgi:hypothetical protein
MSPKSTTSALAIIAVAMFGCSEHGSDDWQPPAQDHTGSATQAYTTLGGVDMNLQCSNVFGAGSRAVLLGGKAWDWRCTVGASYLAINMDQFCRLQYGNQSAVASALNPDDVYSWICYVP